jgi:hypothetical protein
LQFCTFTNSKAERSIGNMELQQTLKITGRDLKLCTAVH